MGYVEFRRLLGNALCMQSRVISLEGIHNFRDYGGYAARDGATIVRDTLWRSAQHGDACAADLDQVHALGIRTIIDLRGDSERTARPCLRHGSFAGDVLYVGGETASLALAPHEEAASGVFTANDARDAMITLYAGLPFRPNLIAAIKLYFEALAERDGPSLLHCVAGKDRTGFAVAILHHLLGVHPDDAMTDYLLTNTASNLEKRLAAGTLTIHARRGQAMGDDAVRTLWSVDEVYLNTALDAVRTRHGTIADYARDVLDVDADRLAKIEARLLI